MILKIPTDLYSFSIILRFNSIDQKNSVLWGSVRGRKSCRILAKNLRKCFQCLTMYVHFALFILLYEKNSLVFLYSHILFDSLSNVTVFISAPSDFSFLKYFLNQISDHILRFLVWELLMLLFKTVGSRCFVKMRGSTICFDKLNRSLDSSGKFRICSFNVYISSGYID